MRRLVPLFLFYFSFVYPKEKITKEKGSTNAARPVLLDCISNFTFYSTLLYLEDTGFPDNYS